MTHWPIDRLASPQRHDAAALLRRLRRRLQLGFTLVELIVLMVVIGIIAAIIIPQMLGAARRSSESALRGDLRNFRAAIERFQADCGGLPPRLDDILAWSGDHVSSRFDGTGRELDLESYHGPYLRTGDMLLPLDPFTDRRDWRYGSATGEVHSNCDQVGRDGTPYSSW
jgi:prepilin-type N-terminal cleavage/methylation domain-containing protein